MLRLQQLRQLLLRNQLLLTYPQDQLHWDRLTPAAGSAQPPAAAVQAAADALQEVREAAAAISSLLTQAETAMLALTADAGK